MRPDDITLDVRTAARPDVCGDIARAPFRSGTFGQVYFERVPFTAFTGRNLGALEEAARVLRLGGRLVIETGRIAPVDEIVAGLRAMGFHSVSVARRGLALAATLRIEAVLGGPSP